MKSENLQEPKQCFFLTLLELNDSCICLNHSAYSRDPLVDLLKTVSVMEVVVAWVGLGLTSAGLAVCVKMLLQKAEGDSRRSGEEDAEGEGVSRALTLHVTMLSLYNILRQMAPLTVGTCTLLTRSRHTVQKVGSLLLLLGHWGCAWTLLDLGLVACLRLSRPDLTRCLTLPAVRARAVGVLLAGLMADGRVLARVLLDKGWDCSSGGYWWGYGADYSLHFLLTSHFVLPHLLLVLVTVCLVAAIRSRCVSRQVRGVQHTRLESASDARTSRVPSQACFVLGLSAWFSACGMLTAVWSLVLMHQESQAQHTDRLHPMIHAHYYHVTVAAELLSLINASTSILLYFLWARFRCCLRDMLKKAGLC